MPPQKAPRPTGLKIAGLFAGIGGIELGLHRAGHRGELLCELDSAAQRVLADRFPGVAIEEDVRGLGDLNGAELVTAGFPCQDLSQAGRTAGITGRNSGLVSHVFRLLDATPKPPEWLMFENVPFMLHLDRGDAMRSLIDSLTTRGYTWAYRVVDSRAFGLPQRRQRVIVMASKRHDPRQVLFADEAGEPPVQNSKSLWRGFYWTEGIRGLGWAIDAVPTLKGGSTIGIASPPAIWNPNEDSIATPDLRDAERLQGFEADWTLAAQRAERVKIGHRWKLVGNAVSVPVAEWVGRQLVLPSSGNFDSLMVPLEIGAPWPTAAFGHAGKTFAVERSLWPVRWPKPRLSEFMQFPLVPLSARAAAGFLGRAQRGNLNFERGFLEAVERHSERALTLSPRETSRAHAGAV